jgi:putative transposase
MPNYRRNYVSGGSYFFTVNLLERDKSLLVDHIDVLRTAVSTTRHKKPFEIDAWVILPDHMHCIWTLPKNDSDYSGRWREIKKSFSKSLPKDEYRKESRIIRNERGIWQHRFWEHTLRDVLDFQRHMDYIHYNPVKHGLVETVKEWPHSTFHHLVKQDVYPLDWAGENKDLNVGERTES